MRSFYAVLFLISFVLAHQSWAKPVDVGFQTRLGLSNVNCIIHCVQPVGQESDEIPLQTRTLMSNYGTFYDCMKKCSQV